MVSTLLATALATPALADTASTAREGATKPAAAPDKPAVPAGKTFSTGVAKGRDLLDSAISASTLDETDLPKLGTSSVVGIIGNLPGIRAETNGIDGLSGLTVRGLPLSDDGSKFMQIQEDGLPVLEFGDIKLAGPDLFVRADIGLSQVQAIRGGSASTFASNSPGGVINLISKTGETAGGAVQFGAGLGYDMKRADFDYGAPIGGGWRFHIGGFYREGEGPRAIGYTGFRGGQVKLNVTRQFANGYIRLYAKYLDDKQPAYSTYPIVVSGTNESPTYTNIPGVDILKDAKESQFAGAYLGVDKNNQPTTFDQRGGARGEVRSIGAEAQFEFGGWTITDKFRFSSINGEFNLGNPLITAPAGSLAMMFAGPGAVLSYAGGPNAGQVITNPATLGGTGLLSMHNAVRFDYDNLDNVTNDLRTSKVWTVGSGKLTSSAGLYLSSQNISSYISIATVLQSIAGDGAGTPINLATASGFPLTQDGVLAYGFPAAIYPTSTFHRRVDAKYRVLAPYASLNYQLGKLAIGGSVRFDSGKVRGVAYGTELGGRGTGTAPIDLNGNGTISLPESQVAILPLSQPGKVDYDYHYTSYSVGANYRIAEPLSVFARYSKGARASAERILFTPAVNYATGQLNDPAIAVSPVKQAEAGLKLRKGGVTVFVTGFWASTKEKSLQIANDATGRPRAITVDRTYSAKGIELESDFRRGPFSLALGATYAKAKIDSDSTDATLVGNRPRHQPSLFFNARPQFEQGIVTIGTNINGTTSSYAQDSNILKQPGYVVVSPFLFVRPLPRVELGVNAFNVFNRLALVSVAAAAIPAGGLVNAQAMNGRTVTGTLRYSF
jgi:hypothetical protein